MMSPTPFFSLSLKQKAKHILFILCETLAGLIAVASFLFCFIIFHAWFGGG